MNELKVKFKCGHKTQKESAPKKSKGRKEDEKSNVATMAASNVRYINK